MTFPSLNLVLVSPSVWRRQWHPTPVLLPGKNHGWRRWWAQSMGSLRVGHNWATSLSRIGEGNGNPLQCSCLENPRDGGGAWWAAVYGVAQSRTRLKGLSRSSTPSVKDHVNDFENYLNPHLLVKVYSLHKARKHMKSQVKIFSLESV